MPTLLSIIACDEFFGVISDTRLYPFPLLLLFYCRTVGAPFIN